jgi:hypothetical protein
LLNPASAFVKACKMIVDVIGFFIERGAQIIAVINSVLDSLEAIIAGNISGAANLVESVLGKAIPVVISFLASLLGLGGFSDKIKQIVKAVQAPINKAIDWLLKTVVKPVVKLAMRAVAWVGGKINKAKQWGKKKWDAAKAKAQSVFGGKQGQGATTDASTKVKQKAHTELLKRISGPFATAEDLGKVVSAVLAGLKPEGLKSLTAKEMGAGTGKFSIIASASAEESVATAEVAAGPIPPQRHLPMGLRNKEFVRGQLYERGSGFSTMRKQINQHAISELMPGIDMLTSWPAPPIEEQRAQIEAWIAAGKVPPEALTALQSKQFTTSWMRNNVTYHIDHKLSLAQHWVQTGHNCDDATRQGVAGNFENLDWITARANLSKGSLGAVVGDGDEARFHYTDHPWVGPSFTSSLVTDGGKKIQGQAFLDEHGKAIH